MSGIDIALYDRDMHNALYYFIVNGDEQIYLRYGGRNAASPDTYLNLDSFDEALRLGLEQHALYRDGKRARRERPEPFFPRDLPIIRNEVLALGRCVECHLIEDYKLQEKEVEGTLDRINDVYRYPDIETIGIHLDIPKGLVVKRVEGPVRDAGMREGDRITTIDGTPVLTFGDFQYFYDKVARDAHTVTLGVERDGASHLLDVDLPRMWWYSDLYHRYLSVDPQLFFSLRPLTQAEKSELGLKVDGFASMVVGVDPAAKAYGLHELKPNDIVYSVDGVDSDSYTHSLEIYLKLNAVAGESLDIKLLRDGKSMDMTIETFRENFRKPDW